MAVYQVMQNILVFYILGIFFLKHYVFKIPLNYFNYLFLGSLETTKVLLEAGADKGAQNKINKTAAQLGAFTGKIDTCYII